MEPKNARTQSLPKISCPAIPGFFFAFITALYMVEPFFFIFVPNLFFIGRINDIPLVIHNVQIFNTLCIQPVWQGANLWKVNINRQEAKKLIGWNITNNIMKAQDFFLFRVWDIWQMIIRINFMRRLNDGKRLCSFSIEHNTDVKKCSHTSLFRWWKNENWYTNLFLYRYTDASVQFLDEY